MKRLSLLFSCILIIQLFCSCASKQEDFEKPVNFYYCNEEISYNSPTGVIQAEVHEGALFRTSCRAFLQAYLQGPVSAELHSFIPPGTELLSCVVEDDIIYIVFSQQFSKLSGVKLMATCSALLMSVHEFSGIRVLNVRAEDSLLDDKEECIISIDDIVLMDTVATQE